MSKMSKFFIAAALCAVALPTVAMAAPITGSGQANFSSLSSCDNSGGSQDCQIVNTGNGSNTQVQWGSTSSRTDFVNPSTLTANDVSINVASNTANVKLAQLTWFNSATVSDDQLSSLGVHYNLTIAFGGGFGDSETFDLTIVNPTNPPGDVISSFTLAELNNLDLTVPGWTINNLHYVADDGSTLCGNNSTSWCNPENNTGHLYIEGNFTQNVQNVPEPLTISLFSAGLAGVAALRRRKQIRA
jgi:hypothetical protein